MKKILNILILCILSFASFSYAKTTKQTLLRDGIVINSAVGKLVVSDSNDDQWFFELNAPITDNGSTIKEGNRIELLPSSSLEMMIDNLKTHLPATYQLRNAKVTKYQGKNYIFPSLFIPVKPVSEIQAEDNTDSNEPASEEAEEHSSNIIDSNNIMSLPTDIMEQFSKAEKDRKETGQRIPDSNFVTIDNVQQELERKRQLNLDSVLLDKNAFFVRDDKGGPEFALDTIGRNVDNTSFRLLPCEALELTEFKQSASPEPLRFKISGIVTKYKGENYLLLYKTTQIYSYGNFAR